MVEDDFFVAVGMDVFDVELGVEFGGDGDGLVGFGEVGEWDFEVGLFVAEGGESFGAYEEGLGVGLWGRDVRDLDGGCIDRVRMLF